MKSGYSGALAVDRLSLSCKVDKCSDTGTGDLGVLTTHETSPLCSILNLVVHFVNCTATSFAAVQNRAQYDSCVLY